MNHIKDIQLVFDAKNLSKYGAFPLLAWFTLDLLRLRDKLRIVSANHKRNNRRKVKRYKCTFSGVDMSIGIITIILVGIKRFEKIDDPFHSGKMPSQRFRSNEAYLYFVSLAYNIFSIFKKTICQRYGKDALLRLLAIEPSVMQSE